MKKVIIITVIVVIAIIIGLFIIDVNKEDTNVTDTETKVGVILNSTIDDRSWNQAHYEGLEKAAEELNLNMTYKECVTTDTVAEKIQELVDAECEIIMVCSEEFGTYLEEAIEMYPEIYFFQAAGTHSGKNLSTYFGRIYQMRYLTGIVAGMQTETDEIGYVAAFPISEVNRGINAFTLGVRSVNPDATVYVRWINSWTDDKAAEDATNTLLENHNIDVMTMHTDSLLPLEVADDCGVMSIGYNIDNSTAYPDTYLTAAVWDWEKFYTPQILKCLQGKFQSGNHWEGAHTGIINIAPLSGVVKDGIEEVVRTEYDRLDSGTFDVFYGPVTDNEGNVRIAEGESMTDYDMLHNFDWYVEGVAIDE